MKIQNWTYSKLIGYVFPSILSILFVSLYTIVDGLFISRYVGTAALAAVNIVYPIYNFAFGISIMICVGGSVLVAISLGAKQYKTANNDFSLVNLVMLIVSLATTLAGLIYINPLLNLLGLTDQLMGHGKIYAQLLLISMPFLTVKIGFEYFLRVDHNATLSFIVTLSGGIINIVLDYLFVAVFNWGVTGAGLATLSGIIISSIMGLYYFIKYAKHLKFILPKWRWKVLLLVCKNGLSELVTEASAGVVVILFNYKLIEYAGTSSVAAYTTLLYIFYVFKSISMGITIGTQPIISFNLGLKSYKTIKDLFLKSTVFIGSISLIVFMIMQIHGEFLIKIFITNDHHTTQLALNGLTIYSFSLLFSGLNIFGIGYLNAVNDGKKAVLISFAKPLCFMIPTLYLLSDVFGLDGIWMTVPAAEVCTFLLILSFLIKDNILTDQLYDYKQYVSLENAI
ncbi:MAG: MATE family efflux transporter [Clostridiales bacterium]|nr:MATE family efflux transporter [Clostridiales bacterium]